MNLFAYGTLMCDDIFRNVAGCRPAAVAGTLEGYSCRCVAGEAYPGITEDPARRVKGMVYLDLPDSAWRRLDRFEGSMYQRRQVTVQLADGTSLLAETYGVTPENVHRLEVTEWDFDRFQTEGKAAFMAGYNGWQAL